LKEVGSTESLGSFVHPFTKRGALHISMGAHHIIPITTGRSDRGPQGKSKTKKIGRGQQFIIALCVAVFVSNRAFQGQIDPKPQSSSTHYEVTHTNFGWNSPSDLNFSRRILTGEVFNATLRHPKYNAKAWAELEEHPDPNRHIVAFLDVESCVESLYPYYGRQADWQYWNAERGRAWPGEALDSLYQSCDYIARAASSKALQANPKNRLVVIECGGFPKDMVLATCNNRSAAFRDNLTDQVIIASYSQSTNNGRPGIDIGFPAPAIKPVKLTARERQEVLNCTKRGLLFSFQGRLDWLQKRKPMEVLDEDPDMYVKLHPFYANESYQNDLSDPNSDKLDYRGLLLRSTFGGVPRGDALYSYRFAEVLSAGTIPVIYADEWLLPFGPAVIDWNEAAVFVREADYSKTGEILRAIPMERICQLKRNGLEIWDTYLSTQQGWVDGLVKSALAQAQTGGLEAV
jgi:hypothetical protein